MIVVWKVPFSSSFSSGSCSPKRGPPTFQPAAKASLLPGRQTVAKVPAGLCFLEVDEQRSKIFRVEAQLAGCFRLVKLQLGVFAW